jgi:uncharacterized lipoprotein YehR (DUF1307 family)
MKKIKSIVLATIVVVSMTGCAQVNPKVQEHALIGAGAGAVITAVTGSSIITGAVVGAVVVGGLKYIQK